MFEFKNLFWNLKTNRFSTFQFKNPKIFSSQVPIPWFSCINLNTESNINRTNNTISVEYKIIKGTKNMAS